jgi:hypothetical protein
MEISEMVTRAKQVDALGMDTNTDNNFDPQHAAPNPLLLNSLSGFVSVRVSTFNLGYLLQTGILRLKG